MRKGERWVVVEAFATGAIVHYRTPFSGGFKCVLAVGTELVVGNDPSARATAVYCEPTNYDELESVLVPQAQRADEKYDSYSLVIELDRFGTALQPVAGWTDPG